MIKKIYTFTMLALATNFAQASKLPEHEKPALEETTPEAKRAKIEKAASGSSDQGKATTSIAASPDADADRSTSSLIAAACSASVAEEAPAKKQTSATTLLTKIEVIPERNLQNIILGYLDKWEEYKTLPGYSEQAGYAWSPDDKYLASGSCDNTIKIWNLAFQEVTSITAHAGMVLAVAWSPNGKKLAYAAHLDHGKAIRIWDVAAGQEVQKLTVNSNMVMNLAYSPDGKYIASHSWFNVIKIWNAKTGKEVKILEGHGDMVTHIAWSKNGKYLASSSRDGTIKIWDTSTWKEVKMLTGHTCMVTEVAWSPNGNYLASGSADRTIKIWNAATGQVDKTLDGHGDTVGSLAWSPDGKQLASGSVDNTIKIWDPITGTCITTDIGHKERVSSVAYSPDGNYLASGSKDETIKIWKNQAREIQSADASSKAVRAELDSVMVGQKPLQEIIFDYLGLC